MQSSEFSDVFVSYRRKDVEFVKLLVEALNASGKEVWIDWEDIPPGSVGFTDDIRRGLDGADAFIAVLSPDYLESPYCVDMELAYAVKQNKKIIPLVLKKFDPAPPPQGIGHINWVYFTPHAGQSNTFEESFPRVIEALDTDLEHARTHRRLFLRAQEWNENNQNTSFLLDGAEITEAEAWLAHSSGKIPVPLPLHTEYIQASRKRQTTLQRQMLAAVSVALVVAVVLLVISVFLFFEAEKGREDARNAYGTSVANANIAATNEQRAVINADLAATSEQRAVNNADQAATNEAQALANADRAATSESLAYLNANLAATNQAKAVANANLAQQNSELAAQREQEAIDNLRQAWEQQSLYLAEVSGQLLDQGNPQAAANVALESLNYYDDGIYNPESWTALNEILRYPYQELAYAPYNQYTFGSSAWNSDYTRILSFPHFNTARLYSADGELLAYLRHAGQVTSAQWNADSTRIATTGEDGVIRIWDSDGNNIITLQGALPLYTAEWNSTGDYLLSWTGDIENNTGAVYVWDKDGNPYYVRQADQLLIDTQWLPDGQHVISILELNDVYKGNLWTLDGNTTTLFEDSTTWPQRAFASDGETLFIISGDRGYLFTRDGALLAEITDLDTVFSATYSPDGKLLIINGNLGSALYDNTGHKIAQYDQLPLAFNTWNDDGKYFFTDDGENTVTVWRSTGEALVSVKHDDQVNGVRVNHNGDRILTWSKDNTARLWDMQGNELQTLLHDDWVDFADWADNERMIVTADFTGAVRLWDIRQDHSVQLPHNGLISSVEWNANGTRLYTTASDGRLRIWGRNGRPIGSLQHDASSLSASWNPDESRILVSSDEGFHLWTTEGLIASPSHDSEITRVFWNADETLLTTLSYDKTVRLWDEEGRAIATLSHSGPISDALWNSTETRLFTYSGRTIYFWDATGERIALHRLNDYVFQARWNGDGTRLFTSQNSGVLTLWDENGVELAQLDHSPGTVSTFNFDATGQRIITTATDGQIRMWDSDGTLLKTVAHSDAVEINENSQFVDAIWNPDKTYFVSVSQSPLEVKLWDMNLDLVASLPHLEPVSDIQWSPEGTHVLTVTVSGDVALWNTDGDLHEALNAAEGSYTVSWNSSGSHFITQIQDGSIQMWSKSGELVAPMDFASGVLNQFWDESGKYLYVMSYENTLYMVDTNGKVMRQVTPNAVVYQATYDPVNETLITVGDSIQVWNTNNVMVSSFGTHANSSIVQWNSDKSLFSVIGDNPEIRLWDQHGDIQAVLPHRRTPSGLLWMEDKDMMLTWDKSGQIFFWIVGLEHLKHVVESVRVRNLDNRDRIRYFLPMLPPDVPIRELRR